MAVTTDPVADLLTRLRNANTANHKTVDIPASRTKFAIAQILKDEGFIKNFKLNEDNQQKMLRIYLKIFAIDTFIFDDGTSTIKCPALIAFLILVNMSEIGSEIPLM